MFGPVSTHPTVAIADEIQITLVMPRRCVEWLDLESVRRKHALGHSKPAKAPIVVELIEREMARQQEQPKAKEK